MRVSAVRRAWLALPCMMCATMVALGTTRAAAADDELEVTVRGSSIDRHSVRDAAAASTVLRRQDLESPGADAAYELMRVPGVQVQRSGGGSELATASLRGTTSAQTPVYLSGIRLNDDLTGTADLSTVPLWMLDRVEVYRGHAPMGLESVGIGGAILFEPRLARGPELRGGFTVGSWGGRSVYGAAGQGSNRSSALIALRREASDNDYGYWDNAGTAYTTADDRWLTRRNAQEATTDAWAIGRMVSSNATQWMLVSNAFERSQGVTGLQSIPAQRAHARIARELLGLSSRTALPCGLKSPCELAAATSFQRATVGLEDPAYELGLGSEWLDSHANRVAQRMGVRWPLAQTLSLSTLVSGGAETLSVARPEQRTLDATRRNGLLELGAEWTASSNVRFLGLFRIESTDTRALTQTHEDAHDTGRVGAAIEPISGLTLTANGGLYARVPTLGELYGTSAFVAGNASLLAERGFNRDFGIRYHSRLHSAALALELFVFQQDIDDLVGWRRSSFGQIRPYNVGKARLHGLETAAGVDFSSVLRFESAVTMLDPRNTTPARTLKNDIIPFRSRLVLDALLEVHTKAGFNRWRLSRASWFFKGAHRGSRYQDEAGLIIIPHSTTFDTGMTVSLANLPVTMRATVYNIFNISSFDTVGYPLAPRTLMLGGELAWERAR